MTSQTDAPPYYRALALQIPTNTVNRLEGRAVARAEMMRAIQHLAEEIPAAKAWIGQDLRLVVLPEYFLTGFPMGDSVEGWADKAALEIDGPEYEGLGAIAQKSNMYISGNAYEQDPHFPKIYFQTSFVIGPSGDVILRYRRLISMMAPSPYDFLDKYLDVYGADALFPVSDTEIGRIGCIASEEIVYPEIARCIALKGAEVFLHSSSEPGSQLPTPKNICKQARALENLAYLVSANSGGLYNYAIGAHSTDGGSKIVDYYGRVMVESVGGESINAFAEIDLAALRRYRKRAGIFNILSRQPVDLYASEFAKTTIAQSNLLMNADGSTKQPDRKFFVERQKNAIASMIDRGLIQE